MLLFKIVLVFNGFEALIDAVCYHFSRKKPPSPIKPTDLSRKNPVLDGVCPYLLWFVDMDVKSLFPKPDFLLKNPLSPVKPMNFLLKNEIFG
ncbi:hypothetical protein GCM10007962_22510 [Yeosuana aromativorans]|uniref:Uncharacterized protein n=1 Tax=Yeosuana aromativorans TaxID=288019 RepID=A0A8J3FJ49_9FLAO|nr:hypothetical protein [Yeosuana aromativorans]GGK27745.1 hypothetical protein GCM10007962_22510 [Yeosuana aromativorans]